MITLSQALNSPELNIKDLKKLLDKSKIDLTFFGSRIITVDGYEGSQNFSIFTKRLNNLAGWHTGEKNLSLADRLDGVKAARKIEQYYKDTDQMRKTADLITRVFEFLQEILNLNGDSNIWLYTERFPIDGCTTNLIVDDLRRISRSLFELSFPKRDVPKTWFNHENEEFIVSS